MLRQRPPAVALFRPRMVQSKSDQPRNGAAINGLLEALTRRRGTLDAAQVLLLAVV
jgi:hypothetical protein